MGITNNFAKLLVTENLNGVSFSRVLTIGRLFNYITVDTYKEICQLKKINPKHSKNYINKFKSFKNNYKNFNYADDFLHQVLDAKEIKSIDISDYENADYIFDLNEVMTSKMVNKFGKFDAIIDGGSFEHIYNLHNLIYNYKLLLKDNGCLFISTMANNHFGHGFYQFSSEFFYRTFDKYNNFILKKVFLDVHEYPGPELSFQNKLYECKDPKLIGKRTLFFNKFALIMISAKKVEYTRTINNDSKYIQSDYSNNEKNIIKNNFIINFILNYFPTFIVNRIIGNYQIYLQNKISNSFEKVKNIYNIYSEK